MVMQKSKSLSVLSGFLLILLSVHDAAADSLKVFKFDDYYALVQQFHPAVKQAGLYRDAAQKELSIARGSFDPKYDFDYTRKVFKNTTYFEYFDHGLKVPTWFGPDIKAGFERNLGLFVNPTNFTPPEGLWYVGLEIPVGMGTFMDERRTAFRQAQWMGKMAEAERVKLVNKILWSASKEYWSWYYYYQRYRMTREGYVLAKTRFEGIRSRVMMGDLSAPDSLEAHILMNERWLEMNNALNNYQNAGLMVSTFLWNEQGDPVEIDTILIPEEPKPMTGGVVTLDKYLSFARSSHPELQKMDSKIAQLKLDRKLRMNNMLPALSVSLKYLNTPNANLNNDLSWRYMQNNYKIMVGLSQPLFIRKERAKYQISGFKVEQAQYERSMVIRDIENSVQSSYNDISTYIEQLSLQEQMVSAYDRLLDAERQRFDAGESSVFMVNSRESKLMDGRIKLYDLRAKLEKAKATFLWSSGMLATTNTF